MKLYFDIYIRPAGPRIDFDNLVPGTNIMDSFDRLELPEGKAAIKISPEYAELGDGTQYVDGEKVEVNCGTLRVDAVEHEYLRDAFHNVPCDVAFFNGDTKVFAAIAYGIKMGVSHIVTQGETRVIKISGSRSMGAGVVDAGAVVILHNMLAGGDAIMISGTVYASDGVTPVANAFVAMSPSGGGGDHYDDYSDKDGNYLILAPADSESMIISVTKSGWEWSSVTMDLVSQHHDHNINFTASQDGA